MLSRRMFLVGLASGMILPRTFDKLVAYVENHGAPLLTNVKNPATTLLAYSGGEEDYALMKDEFMLDPPDFSNWTWRRYAEHYMGGLDAIGWIFEQDEAVKPDDLIYLSFANDTWELQYSPAAQAEKLIGCIDVQMREMIREAGGWITVDDSPFPGVTEKSVIADRVGLSIVQRRLNELGYRVGVSIES